MMPWKLAFSTVNPDTTTPLTPDLGAAADPSTLMPFARPVASMIVVALPAPINASVLVTSTSSLYVPAATWMVSPAEAAATAAPIVLWHPDAPVAFTHSVAAAAGRHATATPSTHSANLLIRETFPFETRNIVSFSSYSRVLGQARRQPEYTYN